MELYIWLRCCRREGREIGRWGVGFLSFDINWGCVWAFSFMSLLVLYHKRKRRLKRIVIPRASGRYVRREWGGTVGWETRTQRFQKEEGFLEGRGQNWVVS